MTLRNTCRAALAIGFLTTALFALTKANAQSITLYPDFYATQYGVAVTSLTQGRIVNLDEGDIWSTNGFNQSSLTFPSTEKTYLLLDAGADGGLSFEVNTTNLPFICGGTCEGELTNGPAAAFNFSLTQLDGIPGCMDDAACNYDPEAGFNDGSCCYESCLTVRLYDAFSNGWVDAQGNIGGATVGNLSGMELGSVQFTEGASVDLDLCVTDDCYVLQLDFDNLAVEASWEVLLGEQVILEGGPGVAGGTIQEFFYVGAPDCLNEGCTEEGRATRPHDGSCEYLTCQIFFGRLQLRPDDHLRRLRLAATVVPRREPCSMQRPSTTTARAASTSTSSSWAAEGKVGRSTGTFATWRPTPSWTSVGAGIHAICATTAATHSAFDGSGLHRFLGRGRIRDRSAVRTATLGEVSCPGLYRPDDGDPNAVYDSTAISPGLTPPTSPRCFHR